MDDAHRSSLDSGKRHVATSARCPVLARLPDVSDVTAPSQPGTPNAIAATNYRFDRPQNAQIQSGTYTSSSSASLNAKLGAAHQPHAFGRSREHRRIPRRASSVLPRSNPFAIPSATLMDSLAPALRFITLVALFTAAGIWLQTMSTRSATPLSAPAEQPKTAGGTPTGPPGE